MKEYFEIVDVMAREILDACGNPTVEAEITLDDGTMGRASVPACDADPENVNTEIAEALLGLNALDQATVDGVLLDVDGTEDASRLGEGALLACSLACAKAAAEAAGLPLCSYIGGINARRLPLPIVDLYDDGDFYLVPQGAESMLDAIGIIRDVLAMNEDGELPEEGTGYRIVSAAELKERADVVTVEGCSTLTMLLEKIDGIRSRSRMPVLKACESESGESILADVAVAVNAEFVCFGSLDTPGSAEKYNELIRIEEELFDGRVFEGWTD